MPFAELEQLHKAYMTAVRHNAFIYNTFTQGIYKKRPGKVVKDIYRRVLWLNYLFGLVLEIAGRLEIDFSFPEQDELIERRYILSITALARGGFEMFRAYVGSEPDLFEMYKADIIRESKRIY